MSTPRATPFAEPMSGTFASADRSIAELFKDLATEVGTLIRQEVTLAKTEMSEKAVAAGKQLGYVGAGALLGSMGLLVLLASLVLGLGEFMALWLAALLVGLVVVAIASALTAKGIATLRKLQLAPTQTLQSLEHDKNLVQDTMR